MTITETVKDTVKDAVSTSDDPRELRPLPSQPYCLSVLSNNDQALALNANSMSPSAIARATREQMSEARLPLPYRDSCAHLLIPLNRCRFEEFYMPWKCVVRYCCTCFSEEVRMFCSRRVLG